MLSLGIESTAHTFGIGIIDSSGKILANEKDTFRPKEGGIKPSDAAKHHGAAAQNILEKALSAAKLSISDIGIIAYSAGPGLSPCLRVGMEFAKKLFEMCKNAEPPQKSVMLVPVNHCMAHVEIAKLATGAKDPIVLYVSGGNSQVIGFAGGKYRVFGETLDIAIGNALDKFARETGIPFPGGPEIERLAAGGRYIPLPYTVKGMDFSFTGIVTNAERKLKSGKFRIEDVCFSFQETAFAMLCEVSERALAHTEKTELLLTGGVAANKRLAKMLEIMCIERGAKFFCAPKELAGDNGVMIAWLGILESEKGIKRPLDIYPKWRVDEC